ncbi:MAG TPA: hypothetical protein VF792_11555 [Ktedonobacterales bacterium]
MRRLSALDHMVQNFQHKWETNPQFRATVSGGLGIAIVVMLCACLGFAFTVSSSLAASVSGTSTMSSSADVLPNGTAKAGSVDNTLTFPTQTPGQVTSAQVPQAQLIPPSLTPQPSPTAPPTPTPLPTTPPGSGGNGGGGGGGCGNCSVTVTGYTFKVGSPSGSVTVHTSNPDAQVNVFVKAPWYAPQNTGSTDGSGNGTISVTMGTCTPGTPVSLWIVSSNSGSTSYTAQCS